ncbi:DUF2267 domain-containing protein [Falsiroseomonas tokyonensis]|uniref:DUF2267 domain-containing protein n=1 Tax=Falsiroseomonas tokyonensis TaxID=430521 RepID=A0ABV7C0R5_9PROT|nr:DUF2267 domain-containing protein [Falsiroseomonas tokyonensis]MBU8541408.1 DUF2267 domain-containing protein [Falsiroseomonas tokyonensis]
MAATSLEVWDRTIQTTNVWLDEIMERIGPARQDALQPPRAVLRRLRARLPVELAVHLGAQLPLLVGGTYDEQWHIGGERLPSRMMEECLENVALRLGRAHPIGPDAITA